jgi:hypothetical protein
VHPLEAASDKLQQASVDKVDKVDVNCNGVPGTLLITTQAIICKCGECTASSNSTKGGRVMTPTEFERHAGASHAPCRTYALGLSQCCRSAAS